MIMERHDQQRRFVSRSYEIDYSDLLAKAKRRLINEVGEKKRDFKHRLLGADRFDKDQLHRRAHNRVVEARSRDLARVDRKEARELSKLMDRSEARTRHKEKPKQDFQKATNRRSGHERRQNITRS